MTTLVESQTDQPDAANFVVGVMTARILVWLLGDDPRQARTLPRLVLAALLQDVGRLPVGPGGLSTRVQCGQRPDWLEQQHPTVGAALFGSIRGAPIELPMLVAQHHEQLDGGGFPRALAARDILPSSAILATAGRFTELCHTPHQAIAAGEKLLSEAADTRVSKSTAARAAETLLSEAEMGKWPIDFSRRLAERVAAAQAIEHTKFPDGQDEVGISEARLRALSTADSAACDRVLQLHDHKEKLQGTHADPAGRQAGNILRDGRSQFENV